MTRFPEVAAPGTVKETCVPDWLVSESATPLSVAVVAGSPRLVPVTTTGVPTGPWAGFTLASVGTDEAAAGGADEPPPPPPPQASSVARAPTRRHRISKRFMVAPKNSPHEVKQSADPGGPSSIKGLWRGGGKKNLYERKNTMV